MFDQIGRRSDPEARKRDALSVAITTLMCAAGVGFVTGLAAWQLGEVVELADLDDEPMTEIVMLDPPDSLVAPAAPGPPALPERAAAARGESPAPQEPPPNPDAPPAPLQDDVPDHVATQAGSPDGIDGGESDGDPSVTSTTGGGGGGGCAEEPCGVGVQVLHHSELDWRRRVEPTYPSAAQELGLGEVTCLATVLIDAKGVPYRVIIADCPEAFHEGTRRAMLRSRWYPPRVDGERTEAQTTIRFRFVPGDEGG